NAYGNHTANHRSYQFKEGATEEEIEEKLRSELQLMKAEYEPIILAELDQYIYYKNSDLLVSLFFYPYVQLSVILVFGLLAYALFNQSKIAEQNRVWRSEERRV